MDRLRHSHIPCVLHDEPRTPQALMTRRILACALLPAIAACAAHPVDADTAPVPLDEVTIAAEPEPSPTSESADPADEVQTEVAEGSAGVVIPTPPPAQAVAIECASNSECTPHGEHLFCLFDLGDCGESGRGQCVNRPEICTLDLRPVCGCDGQEFGNPCDAHRAGRSLRSEEACSQPE